jgi:hypothetical protein
MDSTRVWKDKLLAAKGLSGIGGKLMFRDTFWDALTSTPSSSRAKSPLAMISTLPDSKNEMISSDPERSNDPCDISILPPNEQFLQETVMPCELSRVSRPNLIQHG